ncbi:MAG: glycosyltransferase [Proteobacteria bacterium]|nr:glycosyltransferase [Pseudomonadota bacterium]
MAKATILLAGGGTGGHIYPNVAVAERLLEQLDPADWAPHFLLSSRVGDREILTRLGYSFSTSPVKPFPPLSRPWRLFSFFLAWRRAVHEARQLLRENRVAAVVATGGFVSGPAVVAARAGGVPCALVNLDAIPGVANRRLARHGPELFSVYQTSVLPAATRIGLPLRRASVGDGSNTRGQAREALGLDPDKPMLFITGATHGASSIIQTMMTLIGTPEHAALFDGWQVFHQCGTFEPRQIQDAYDRAAIPARVVAYFDQMGRVWQAADLAISRAGAGSVAEAWANCTPTLFLPNPYHRDQHQKHNAQPVIELGGAVMIRDRIDPGANLPELCLALQKLLPNPAELDAMRQALRQSRPPDGAAAVARWVVDQIR